MKKKIVLALALLSVSTVGLADTLTSMNGNQVKTALTDKTITTVSEVTLNGKLVNNSFTGYINKDGTMMGKFSNPSEDGAPQSDKGTWKVQSNGQFCFKWQSWDNAKERCVTFYKLNNALLVVGSGNKFETLILDTNIQDGNQMSA